MVVVRKDFSSRLRSFVANCGDIVDVSYYTEIVAERTSNILLCINVLR